MQVILTEKIRHLGNLGDKVEVKAGFARNYLIPQQKAVHATAANLEAFEAKRAELEKKAQVAFAKAEQRASKINDTLIVIEALSSDEGKLYGSIGTHEIKHALEEKGIEIDKKEIVLSNGSFHETGEYAVEIFLHSDVEATLQLHIKAAK